MNLLNQTQLYGLDYYFNEITSLYNKNRLPNKIILSGQKGLGKFTLAIHIINYILSKNEDFTYDIKNFKINENNRSYKLIINNSSSNFYLIDVPKDKKNIEINQIRELINFCNKSSLNDQPRFILVNNLGSMNLNSSNALLRTLEEPNDNIYFILINSSHKILPTIKSRCLDFKVNLSQKECMEIFNKITKQDIHTLINKDLIPHYFTTGDLVNLHNFSIQNDIDLLNISLKNLLLKIIDGNHYKKDDLDINLIHSFIQIYFFSYLKSNNFNEFYTKFIESVENVKRFNLDIESIFIQFRHHLTNE